MRLQICNVQECPSSQRKHTNSLKSSKAVTHTRMHKESKKGRPVHCKSPQHPASSSDRRLSHMRNSHKHAGSLENDTLNVHLRVCMIVRMVVISLCASSLAHTHESKYGGFEGDPLTLVEIAKSLHAYQHSALKEGTISGSFRIVKYLCAPSPVQAHANRKYCATAIVGQSFCIPFLFLPCHHQNALGMSAKIRRYLCAHSPSLSCDHTRKLIASMHRICSRA